MVGAAMAACRRPPARHADAVTLTQVTPPTVTLRAGEVTEIVLRGSGFDETDNTVTLGPVTVTSVKSTDGGTQIRMLVPDRVTSGGGAPPMLWVAGDYPVTVTNHRGTSASVMLTVKEPS